VKFGLLQVILSEQSGYSIIASPIDEEGRFLLHFGTVGIEDTPIVSSNNDYLIYSSDNSVYIKNVSEIESKGEIRIYNIMGQEIYQSRLESIPVNKIDLYEKAGYYIVKLFVDNGIYSEKVFIK